MLKPRSTRRDTAEKTAALEEVTAESMARINFNVPASLRREFKAVTAKRGEDMTEVLLTFVKEYVSKYSL